MSQAQTSINSPSARPALVCCLAALLISPALAHANLPSGSSSLAAPPSITEDSGETISFDDAFPLSGRALFTVGPDANCDFSGLQPAINAASDGDVINVANGNGYSGQRYAVFGKSLTIRGGFSDCDFTSTPSGRTTLNANQSGLVMDVWQTNTPPDQQLVVLENLTLTGGSNGGLLVQGQPGRLQVTLRNVDVSNNQNSSSGGGIRLLSEGPRLATTPGPMLTLDDDSFVTQNTSNGDGGGIFCSANQATGGTLLRIGTTLVFSNQANNGGGIAINGCRNVFLYSGAPAFLFIPTGGIYLNEASENGGGIHVSNGATVTLSSNQSGEWGDDNHAAMLVGNSAEFGGGAYVIGSGSRLSLTGTVVRTNTAELGGGGLYVAEGAELNMRGPNRACLPPESDSGVTSTPPCSRLSDNDAASGGTVSNGGGGIRVRDGAQATLQGTFIQGNNSSTFGSAARVQNVDNSAALAELHLESTLITGNNGHTTVYAGSNSLATVAYSTLADNTGHFHLMRAFAGPGSTADIVIHSSIAHDPGANVVTRGGAGATTASTFCAIGHQLPEDTELTVNTWYRQMDPEFVDRAAGDYRLSATSPAIDFCDNTHPPVINRDLDRNIRNVAWEGPPPSVPNPGLGNYDLGAFEAQFDSDLIFANGFE